jgi:hypothetical protein
METVWFSKTLASTDESTRSQNTEEQHRHPRRRENLKSHFRNIVEWNPQVTSCIRGYPKIPLSKKKKIETPFSF